MNKFQVLVKEDNNTKGFIIKDNHFSFILIDFNDKHAIIYSQSRRLYENKRIKRK